MRKNISWEKEIAMMIWRNTKADALESFVIAKMIAKKVHNNFRRRVKKDESAAKAMNNMEDVFNTFDKNTRGIIK